MGAIMNRYYFTSSTKHNIYILHRNFQGFIQFQPGKIHLTLQICSEYTILNPALDKFPINMVPFAPLTPYPNNQQTNYAYWCGILGTVYNIVKCPGDCLQYYTGIAFG